MENKSNYKVYSSEQNTVYKAKCLKRALKDLGDRLMVVSQCSTVVRNTVVRAVQK